MKANKCSHTILKVLPLPKIFVILVIQAVQAVTIYVEINSSIILKRQRKVSLRNTGGATRKIYKKHTKKGSLHLALDPFCHHSSQFFCCVSSTKASSLDVGIKKSKGVERN
jgi:hypothetical protein